MNRRHFLAASLLSLAVALPASAQDKYIVVASTTSTEQSGLFGHLLPIFEKDTGISVRVVALGTGQALDAAPGAATPMSLSSTTRRRRKNSSPKGPV